MKSIKSTKRPNIRKHHIPIKQTANVVLHVRVPEWQLKFLRKQKVDIPALVRQTFYQACEEMP